MSDHLISRQIFHHFENDSLSKFFFKNMGGQASRPPPWIYDSNRIVLNVLSSNKPPVRQGKRSFDDFVKFRSFVYKRMTFRVGDCKATDCLNMPDVEKIFQGVK